MKNWNRSKCTCNADQLCKCKVTFLDEMFAMISTDHNRSRNGKRHKSSGLDFDVEMVEIPPTKANMHRSCEGKYNKMNSEY